jgi:uncharacterized protein YecT (DUF1311 family)
MVRILSTALLVLIGLSARANAKCDQSRNEFDTAYCFAQAFHAADQTLNANYVRLRDKLSAPRQNAMTADELAWLRVRDRLCGRHTDDGFFVDLACAATMTEAHGQFLADRYRDCVDASCSDLDFYNAQDVATSSRGPTLSRYPTTSKYHGPDAGYVAVYTHDPANALYSSGGNVYVTGFIRLRGRYEGRIFRPMGYESADISAALEFKKLTETLFPGRRGGTWAGGDTGGFVEN